MKIIRITGYRGRHVHAAAARPDVRANNPGAGARADAIIIAHVPAGLREAYLISIPRDLLVPIPGHRRDKINAAYQLGGGGSGGAQLLSATLRDLAGTGFDGAAILDLDRGRNHQRLIRAMVDQAAGAGLLTDPLRLDRTIRALRDSELASWAAARPRWRND